MRSFMGYNTEQVVARSPASTQKEQYFSGSKRGTPKCHALHALEHFELELSLALHKGSQARSLGRTFVSWTLRVQGSKKEGFRAQILEY